MGSTDRGGYSISKIVKRSPLTAAGGWLAGRVGRGGAGIHAAGHDAVSSPSARAYFTFLDLILEVTKSFTYFARFSSSTYN